MSANVHWIGRRGFKQLSKRQMRRKVSKATKSFMDCVQQEVLLRERYTIYGVFVYYCLLMVLKL